MNKSIFTIIFIIILSQACFSESLFTPGTARKTSLFTDPSARASQVGDIITIVIDAATDVNTTNTYKSEKSYSTIPLTMVQPFEFLPFSLSGDSSSGNKETGQRKFDFASTMSATIQEVLPNGNFVIMGERQIFVGEKKQLMQFTGVVRPGDIAQDNTVVSTKIANVSLTLDGELGEIEEKKGILTRLIDWIF